jgi:hypothetical protein
VYGQPGKQATASRGLLRQISPNLVQPKVLPKREGSRARVLTSAAGPSPRADSAGHSVEPEVDASPGLVGPKGDRALAGPADRSPTAWSWWNGHYHHAGGSGGQACE